MSASVWAGVKAWAGGGGAGGVSGNKLWQEKPSRVCRGKSGANRALTVCTFLRTWKKTTPEGDCRCQPCEAHPRFSQVRPPRSLWGHRLLSPNALLLPWGLGFLICEMRGGFADSIVVSDDTRPQEYARLG